MANDTNIVLVSATGTTIMPNLVTGSLLVDGTTIQNTNSGGDVTITPNGDGKIVSSRIAVDDLTLIGNSVSSTSGNVVLSPAANVIAPVVKVEDITLDGNTVTSGVDSLSIRGRCCSQK